MTIVYSRLIASLREFGLTVMDSSRLVAGGVTENGLDFFQDAQLVGGTEMAALGPLRHFRVRTGRLQGPLGLPTNSKLRWQSVSRYIGT